MRLSEQVLLIAGGSSGLGRACCEHFLSRGSKVVIADVKEPGWTPSGDGMFVPMDVTSEDAVRNAIDTTIRHFGKLSGAVICAGILHAEKSVGRSGPHSLDAFRKVIEVNLIGSFNVVRLAAEAMAIQAPDERGERGVIVLTSSVAAFDGQIGQCAYAASKGAIASLTLPLARELGQHGIRVATIAPGVFETPMMQAAPEKVRHALLDVTPFPHRFGEPAEFAALVEHILSNQMINGTVIRLDAGIRLPFK